MENPQEYINDCYSLSDVSRKLCGYVNGSGIRKATELVEKNNLDISHFDNGISKKAKWKVITKECPVCGTEFETREGHPKEKQTCGYACSNTYFRSGENHGNWREESGTGAYGYRKVCFTHHEQKCVVCGEDKIVAVHHLDENNQNNDPKNLIPLCPTHHSYWHSKYRSEIEGIVSEYVKNKWG